MDVQQIEIDAMKEIVDTCVGIPLFTYEMQVNAERPKGPYAAIKCMSSFNPGMDETSIVEVDGVDMFRSRGIRILTFMIMFSREGQEYIDFDNSFWRPDVYQVCKKNNFAALGKEALNLSSITLETNWEFRQGIKMQFNVLREQLSPVGTMSYAHVGGKFIDGNQVINVQET